MRFPADNGADRQDPLIAPIGTLVDAVGDRRRRRRARARRGRGPISSAPRASSCTSASISSKDETEQSLALTNRVWVPPMDYKSLAPYAQLSYDIGPVTFAGGVRHEDGELKVNDYTTTFFRNRVFVEGGTLEYKEDLFNAGVIWRIVDGFSVFVSYSEGFTLPNIGIPLRNVNTPGQSVEGILDLRRSSSTTRKSASTGAAGWAASAARTTSRRRISAPRLSVDPVTRDFVLIRAPVEIKGFEVTAEFRRDRQLRSSPRCTAHTEGKTTAAGQPNGPLNIEMGVDQHQPRQAQPARCSGTSCRTARSILGATSLHRPRHQRGPAPAEEHTHGYTLYDLTVNYDTERCGAFSLGVENLTDKFYFLSFSQIDFFRNYFAGRGRTVSLTYRIRLLGPSVAP